MITPIKLPYARPCIEESDCACVLEVLREGLWITRGPKVRSFEEQLANRVGARHCICFANASAALWAACQAANIQESDEAWVPTNTFIATSTCAMQKGAYLRLIEIDASTGNVDIASMSALIDANPTRRRRFFLPVHFAGCSIDMRKFSNSLKGWSDVIIEDAAHAIGSCYPTGEPVGSCAYSDMTVFSFHAVKNITCGEGGAVTTNSDEYANRLRRLRNSGIVTSSELGVESEKPWFYDVQEISCQMHMNELQAALGLSQLQRLDSIGQRKSELMQIYREHLDPSLDLILADPQVTTHYHLAVALIDFETFQTTRAGVMKKLAQHGIGSQVHYIPLYRHSIISSYPKWLKPSPDCNWHASEDYYSRALSLPLFPFMKKQDVLEVVEHLHQALAN